MAGTRRLVGGPSEGGVRVASLRAWIEEGRVPAPWRPSAELALATPWCWPRDPALAEAARCLGYTAPPSSGVGEALLVSVAAHDDRSALWRLAWGRRAIGDAVPFGQTSERCISVAVELATAVAPHLHTLAPMEKIPQGASLIFKRGRSLDRVLEGESFGLSMLLALTSALLERPIPSRFAASASLRSDGSLGRVGGIDRKLSLLADSALGVDTVFVAEAQRDEARRIVEVGGWLLDVVGVAHVREAIARVFPDARATPPEAWNDARNASAAVEQLLSLCRQGGAVREWSAVERSASWLVGRFDTSSTHRECERARFALQVASRHANGRAVEIPWDESITRKHDMVRASHAVQAASDAGSSALEDYLTRARAMIDSVSPETDDLKLLGAVGRGLSARRRYGEANDVLAAATRAWVHRGLRVESSYPLSEWVRVAALLGDTDRWAEARSAAEEYLILYPDGDFGSLFVRFALGRGLATMGALTGALEVLDDEGWSIAPAWLSRSRRRWRALALESGGRDAEARALREVIAAETDEDGATPVEALFVALDETVARGEDPAAVVRAVREANPQGVRWLLDDALGPEEQTRRLAREYPY